MEIFNTLDLDEEEEDSLVFNDNIEGARSYI
jgi:hypothetical protein